MMRVIMALWRRLGLVALAAGMSLLYLGAGTPASDGLPLMPVDDAYIHFQYAKQAGLGQPFVYNPGEGPTSGATSLLYPFVLAAGWRAGWQGLALGYWAVLIGGVALAACGLLARRIVRFGGAEEGLAEAVGASVVMCGALVWHAVSGMETVLMCALTLAVFDAFVRERRLALLVFAALLTITRPEGGILAGLACGLALVRSWRAGGWSVGLWLYALPVAAMAIQPVINGVLTGSFSASGGQAKSLLSLVPQDWGYIAERIAANAVRMMVEWLTGIGEGGIGYVPPMLGVLALMGMAVRARRAPFAVLLAALWLLALTAAISTLDTAFWHFKRYQMPALVLAFVLAGWGLAGLSRRGQWAAGGLLAAVTVLVGWPFLGYYRDNTASVAAQPYAMASWLRANVPAGARVAVHDVGMMRYYGEVQTVDMVGLTTAGAAEAWRHGVGAVAEWLMSLPRGVDYYAAYDRARGLSYLVDALESVPPGVLAEFVHRFDPSRNVALGGERQVIVGMEGLNVAHEGPLNGLLVPALSGYQMVDALNVAALADEQAHAYQWTMRGREAGFPTEFYRLTTLGCGVDCPAVPDGGRRITGAERFVMQGMAGQAHVLVTRVHPVNGLRVTVTVNDVVMGVRVIPAQPGQWLELWTPIPAALSGSDGRLHVAVETDGMGGAYMPYHHWLYAGTLVDEASLAPAQVQFAGAGAMLERVEAERDGALLTVRMTWRAWDAGGVDAVVDAVAFAHLYADLDQPPVRQVDMRTGRGAYPPGNWAQPVARFTDEFVLDLSSLAAGRYALAVGLYDPRSGVRFVPTVLASGPVERAGRVVVTEILID